MARVMAGVEFAGFREVIYSLYHSFRTNKLFVGPKVRVLILDGHETSASYLRHCDGCLQRKVRTAAGERIQYYHRNVTAVLQGGNCVYLMDAEAQRPGEDEVAAALRLFERIVRRVPRAFDTVLADGLYVRQSFVGAVREHGKHLIAVLKENCPDLLEDARGLFAHLPPREVQVRRTRRLCWDEAGFRFGPDRIEVRVVRSHETTRLHRADGAEEMRVADWYWVTTLSPEQVDTDGVITLGHRRWAIENRGFNELVNGWAADHVYHHHPTAIMAFWLVALLAYNLFHAFVERRIQPALRCCHTVLHWAREMAADLYRDVCVEAWPLPP
jgi:hypothetical protein